MPLVVTPLWLSKTSNIKYGRISCREDITWDPPGAQLNLGTLGRVAYSEVPDVLSGVCQSVCPTSAAAASGRGPFRRQYLAAFSSRACARLPWGAVGDCKKAGSPQALLS